MRSPPLAQPGAALTLLSSQANTRTKGIELCMLYVEAEEDQGEFVERQMWADVLREAYAVKNLSEDLTKFVQTVPERFCPLARAMPKCSNEVQSLI